MAPPRPLVLASTSPYRAALLERLGLPFTAHSPDVDESVVAGETPRDRALRLAQAKTAALADVYPLALVIGGDQVASTRGTLLRKPGSAERCREQLAMLSGSTAEFHTACAVSCRETGFAQAHVDLTTVRVRTLGADEIARYIDREKPFDCAGGFKAEALGISLFERMDSEDPTAIIGTPLIWLAAALRRAGFAVP